jgi:hypothetical protein
MTLPSVFVQEPNFMKFNEEEWAIAEIPVPVGQKSLGIRIGLGRIFKQDKITNIEVYERTDGKAVVLKKK